MSKIKVAELFYSIQGEGRYMGVPSVFLRTFGCNFTCDSFGMPRGEKSQERHNIVVSKYKTYNELPLVSSGCDSYASWMPEFKDLSPMLTTDAIADRICEIIPHNEWQDEHLATATATRCSSASPGTTRSSRSTPATIPSRGPRSATTRT